MLFALCLLSFVGFFVGLISVAWPLRVLRIRSRRMGLAVLTGSFVVFVVSATVDGARQPRSPASQQLAAAGTATPKSSDAPATASNQHGGRYAKCEIFLEESILADKGYGSYDGRDADNALITWKTCKSGVDMDRKYPELAGAADPVENAERSKAEALVAAWRAEEQRRKLAAQSGR